MKKLVFVLMSLVSMSLSTFAQPNSDGLESINDVPVNSWIVMLLIIGIGSGVIKLYSTKKASK